MVEHGRPDEAGRGDAERRAPPDAEQRRQFVELGVLFDLDDPISTFRVGEDGYGLSQVEWRSSVFAPWRDPTGTGDEEMDGQPRGENKKTRLAMLCGCCLAVIAAPVLCCCKEG